MLWILCKSVTKIIFCDLNLSTLWLCDVVCVYIGFCIGKCTYYLSCREERLLLFAYPRTPYLYETSGLLHFKPLKSSCDENGLADNTITPHPIIAIFVFWRSQSNIMNILWHVSNILDPQNEWFGLKINGMVWKFPIRILMFYPKYSMRTFSGLY